MIYLKKMLGYSAWGARYFSLVPGVFVVVWFSCYCIVCSNVICNGCDV